MKSDDENPPSPSYPSNLTRHIERQKNILRAITGTDVTFDLGCALEKLLFTPEERPDTKIPDPRLNFYPPFLVPESLAQHFPFFLTVPIPRSCKANRIGTDAYRKWAELSQFPELPPDPTAVKWDDSIGNVRLSAELKSDQKLALLKDDHLRLMWCKLKGQNLTNWSYPSLSLPPQVQKLLLETFVGKPQNPNKLDQKYEVALTDELFIHHGIPKDEIPRRRELACTAATYGTLLTCMCQLMSTRGFIKNCQESLHYTFGHGFVQLLNTLAEVNLSEFVTYHGLTHRNRLNNNRQQAQLDETDRHDYLTDTIYLFLVFCWQTAMDVWGQTIDDSTSNIIMRRLQEQIPDIIKLDTSDAMSNKIASIIFPTLISDALTSALPDFVNQAQLSNFRTFISMKSGVPQSMVPFLPSDMVPIDFRESHPILWSHVLLLKLSAFLTNHGDYMRILQPPYTASSVYCECNLCSPHKMPCYNPNLLNEVLSIDNFEFQGPPDENGKPTKSLKLTPQKFANAFLAEFNLTDFFHNKVCHYNSNKTQFSSSLEACLIKDPSLLAKLREIQTRREKELLKRGSGIYLDPETGEPITNQTVDEDFLDEPDLPSAATTQRQRHATPLPTLTPRRRGTPHPKRGKPRRNSHSTEPNNGRFRDLPHRPGGPHIIGGCTIKDETENEKNQGEEAK